MFRRLLSVVLLCVPASAYAHEFWIAPQNYQVSVGDTVQADFRVGQDFKGASYAWVPHRTTQSLTVENGVAAEYFGTVGDRPAMSVTPESEGLLILAHETRSDSLTYREWQKFIDFVEHKDFAGALARHKERGLEETDFVETYRRYAKTLVGVGASNGADSRVGFDVELVALDNPYTLDGDAVTVQIWKGDVALADVQIEVFEMSPEGEVTVTRLRSDANGTTDVPVQKGYYYMVDHVALEERDGTDTTGAVWHTMWANLTFSIPS